MQRIGFLLITLLLSSLNPASAPAADRPVMAAGNDAADLEAGLADLARQIAESINQGEKTKIAIVEFCGIDGKVTGLGKFISEELITRLFLTQRFEVVERALLERVMQEHALNLSGLVDPESAKELGRILGVDAIVTGTIADLGKASKINARMISTESGSLFAVAATTVPNTSEVLYLRKQVSGQANPASGDKAADSLSSDSTFDWSQWRRESGAYSGSWEFSDGVLTAQGNTLSSGAGDWTYITHKESMVEYEVSCRAKMTIVGNPNAVAGFSFGPYMDWVVRLEPDRWYTLKISVKGGQVMLFVDGNKVAEQVVSYPTGNIQLKLCASRVLYTNIAITHIS